MPSCMFCDHNNPASAKTCASCGAELPGATATNAPDSSNVPGAADGALLDLIADGRKIEAIKLYRERTGLGLKEAKDAIEALERGNALAAPPSTVGGISEDEIITALERGNKIQAIRLFRERTGVGLKEAKDAVEAIAARHGIVSKGSGCAGVLAVCFVAGWSLLELLM